VRAAFCCKSSHDGVGHDVDGARASAVPPARRTDPRQAAAQGDLHGRAGEFARCCRPRHTITTYHASYPCHATVVRQQQLCRELAVVLTVALTPRSVACVGLDWISSCCRNLGPPYLNPSYGRRLSSPFLKCPQHAWRPRIRRGQLQTGQLGGNRGRLCGERTELDPQRCCLRHCSWQAKPAVGLQSKRHIPLFRARVDCF